MGRGPGRPGEKLGTGARPGSRCPGTGLRSRAHRGRGSLNLRGDRARGRRAVRGASCPDEAAGAGSASAEGPGVQGPSPGAQRAGSPVRAGQCSGAKPGTRRFGGSQLGGAGDPERPSKCWPLAPRPLWGPGAAAAASQGRISIDPAPGAGWPRGGLLKLISASSFHGSETPSVFRLYLFLIIIIIIISISICYSYRRKKKGGTKASGNWRLQLSSLWREPVSAHWPGPSACPSAGLAAHTPLGRSGGKGMYIICRGSMSVYLVSGPL